MKSLLSKLRNKKELPADSACRNCGTELIAGYCHNCGQDYFAGSEQTVGEILYNTVDTIFAWDNKIFKTIKYLLFYPGKLTNEFLSGKIIQYVYPAKLFWFTLVLFFACIDFANTVKIGGLPDTVEPVATSDITAKSLEEEETETNASKVSINIKFSADSLGEGSKNRWEEKIEQAVQESGSMESFQSKVMQNITGNLPYMMLLLTPFFAFLLFILFRKRKKYYANHLVFTMHFHAFFFLFYTIYMLLSNRLPETWGLVINILGLLPLLPIVYFAFALRAVYRPGIIQLLWKIPFILLTYGAVCIATLVLLVMLAMFI